MLDEGHIAFTGSVAEFETIRCALLHVNACRQRDGDLKLSDVADPWDKSRSRANESCNNTRRFRFSCRHHFVSRGNTRSVIADLNEAVAHSSRRAEHQSNNQSVSLQLKRDIDSRSLAQTNRQPLSGLRPSFRSCFYSQIRSPSSCW